MSMGDLMIELSGPNLFLFFLQPGKHETTQYLFISATVVHESLSSLRSRVYKGFDKFHQLEFRAYFCQAS